MVDVSGTLAMVVVVVLVVVLVVVDAVRRTMGP